MRFVADSNIRSKTATAGEREMLTIFIQVYTYVVCVGIYIYGAISALVYLKHIKKNEKTKQTSYLERKTGYPEL